MNKRPSHFARDNASNARYVGGPAWRLIYELVVDLMPELATCPYLIKDILYLLFSQSADDFISSDLMEKRLYQLLSPYVAIDSERIFQLAIVLEGALLTIKKYELANLQELSMHLKMEKRSFIEKLFGGIHPVGSNLGCDKYNELAIRPSKATDNRLN